VWITLTLAFFTSLAPLPAASESPALRPWIEPSPEGPQRTFILDDLRGAPRDLQAFKGNVVLLHFFATWCEPCVREITSLQKLTSIARDKPLRIVAIDVAEVDLRVHAFFEKLPVDFPVLLDRNRAVTRAWQVSALPSTVVLAPDLTPRLFVEGDLDWSRPDVLTTIEKLYPAATPRTEPITIQTINNPREETTR
jgi:thiol-disulfide isomerase/thioredoxin